MTAAFRQKFARRAKGAKGRYVKGVMNANEQAFAKVLDEWKLNGRILWYEFEGITLNLAPRTTLTIDFAVVHDDLSMALYEVKSGQKTGKPFTQGDAVVKMKMAAAKFPHIPIIITWVHKTYPRKYKEVGAHGADDITVNELMEDADE